MSVFLWPYGVSNPSEIGCPPFCGQLRRVRPFRVTVSTAKLQLSRRHVHCPASIHPCTHRSRRRFDPYALNGSAEEESRKLDRDNTLFRYYCCATITIPCRCPCDGTGPGKSQKRPLPIIHLFYGMISPVCHYLSIHFKFYQFGGVFKELK